MEFPDTNRQISKIDAGKMCDRMQLIIDIERQATGANFFHMSIRTGLAIGMPATKMLQELKEQIEDNRDIMIRSLTASIVERIEAIQL